VSVTLDESGETVRLPVQGARLAAGAPVTFGVRPEHLELVDGGASSKVSKDAQDTLTIARAITLVEELGEHSYVHVDQPGGAVLIAKAPGDARLQSGDTAQFRASANACHLFAEDGFAVAPLATVDQAA